MLDDRECQIQFGRFIKQGREAKKLYQSQVATSLDLSQQYYSLIETGARNVDLVLALKICEVLQLNLSDFIRTYIK